MGTGEVERGGCGERNEGTTNLTRGLRDDHVVKREGTVGVYVNK